MRSAPTLNSWMMPFSSVAMIEKLALVRMAFCSAPVLSRAFWRRCSTLEVSIAGADMTDHRWLHLDHRWSQRLPGPASAVCSVPNIGADAQGLRVLAHRVPRRPRATYHPAAR